MKVLIAVDGSESSQRALEYVAQMPWKPNTEFCLFSAIYLWEEDFTVLRSSYDMAKERAKKKVIEGLEKDVKYLREKVPGIVVSFDYNFDRAREAIVEKAFTYKADLIVMGSHGRSGFKKLLMGSVAEYVSNVARCSVQIVKDAKQQDQKSKSA
ncbi:MAG: universal stress protein [Candidatus Melainabacteria bacterium]|nr:MAG: universal stress protein [Candidatus Melainabacteria bacterium]